MLDAPVPGKRRRERQKTRRKDSCKRDTVGLKEEDALDRTKWKNDIHNRSSDLMGKVRGDLEEKAKPPQSSNCHRRSWE